MKTGRKQIFVESTKKPFKKNEKFQKQNKSSGKGKNDKPNFSFSKAKFEVQKLSLGAYKGAEKRQAMISYLVELGAQPPKVKRCENYKLLTARKRAEKEKKEKDKRNENINREEQLKKLITKADHSIKQYNKILRKKKKRNKQKKQKH